MIIFLRVKKERDEIKNDLSESITDVPLQEEQEKCEQIVKEFEEFKLNDCQASKGLEKQCIESKQACDAVGKQLEEERLKCKTLVKELEQYKSQDCRAKGRLGNFPFEMELHKAKKESEELGKELAEERRAHETLR